MKDKFYIYAVKKRHSRLKYMGTKCHEKSACRQAKRYSKKGYYQIDVFRKNSCNITYECIYKIGGNIENGQC